MGGVRRVLVVAGVLAVAGAASADCPTDGFAYAPAYVGTFKSYGFATDFTDPIQDFRAVSGKTGRICADCADEPRGVLLGAKHEFGGGFFQYPVPVGESFCASLRVDVSRVTASGALAGFEFDSPAVAIDVTPMSYVFVGIQDEDGTKTVWVDESGESVGTPLALPAGTTTAVVEVEYGGGNVSVRARAEQDAGLTDVLTSHPFAWDGSGGLGAGAFDLAQGDRVGIATQVHGDVHDPLKQAVLAELQAVLDLEDAALTDLGAAATADARAKLDEAATRTTALLDAVAALPAAKANAKAAKELGKAAQKLAAAVAAIDAATPEGLEAAPGLVEKARTSEHKARRILETGSAAEGKVAG